MYAFVILYSVDIKYPVPVWLYSTSQELFDLDTVFDFVAL